MCRFPSIRWKGFSLIVIAIIVILGVALSKLNTREGKNTEVGAIKTITTLHAAQAQYHARFGRYANNLTELDRASLITSDLPRGQRGGYKYEMRATPSGYMINADPVAFDGTGSRTFFSDQSFTLRQNFSAEPANASSAELR